MSSSDENFKDSTGLIWIPIGIAVLVTMPTLTAVVGWYKVFFVY